MKKKIDSYLGFASKSRNLATGSGTCQIMAAKGKLKLLIITEDIAEGSKEKLIRLANSNNIPYRIYGLSENLSQITGVYGRTVFGITDEKFATVIKKEIDSEMSKEKEVF